MRSECVVKEEKDGIVLDCHLDQRIYDDDPIWEAIELVDGIVRVYSPKEIKALMKQVRNLLKYDNPDDKPDDFEEDLAEIPDRGRYKMQVLIARLFTPEQVIKSLEEFFNTWQNGKERIS